jgi:hypothetical protein
VIYKLSLGVVSLPERRAERLWHRCRRSSSYDRWIPSRLFGLSCCRYPLHCRIHRGTLHRLALANTVSR